MEQLAIALNVSVSNLIGEKEKEEKKRGTGPASQLQRKLEQVKLLPREKQKFVLQFLDTVLESNQKV